MHCHQRSQYIRPNSKKNSFRGNYSRIYGSHKNFDIPGLNKYPFYSPIHPNFVLLLQNIVKVASPSSIERKVKSGLSKTCFSKSKLLKREIAITMQSFSFFYAFSLIFALVNAFPDWLIENIDVESRLRILPNDILELTNGLISRQFTLKPGFATINFFSHEKKSSLLR